MADDSEDIQETPYPNRRKRYGKQHPLTEADVEQAVVEWAEDEGWTQVKMNVRGVRGWPDRFFLFAYPCIVFIEFKAPGGGSLSEQQIERINDLKNRGFDVGVFDDAERAIAFLDAKKNAVKRRETDARTSMLWAVVEARARKNIRSLHGVSHPSRKRLR